ncbi:MAG: HI0074 family nucleotidyltransferase substrate-binding subunit [Eubacteriales bacterium]|jgi:nucleotidyltransferase substrate binding protein (TIGR01987 family)
MDVKALNRYKSFVKSLNGLAEAEKRDPSDDFVLSGTIQKFCLTFDISWKVMKDIAVKYYKVLDFATGSPRECLRVACSLKLISDDRWMQMLNLRNELAHDYDGSLAKNAFHTIVEEYIPLFTAFAMKAGRYFEDANKVSDANEESDVNEESDETKSLT